MAQHALGVLAKLPSFFLSHVEEEQRDPVPRLSVAWDSSRNTLDVMLDCPCGYS